MDQEIIEKLKTLYHKELVHMTLAYLEETILNQPRLQLMSALRFQPVKL